MPRFQDIPQFTQAGNYEVDVHLKYLRKTIGEYTDAYGLEMCPDFQRGHVWTEQQQIRFMEYLLRGGRSARIIYFNHPGWDHSFEGRMVLVDGLQRLTAALRFLNDEIPVFGYRYSEYEDKPHAARFRFNVNNLKTREEVLQWYIDFNSGGTVHTDEEIARVRALLEAEKRKEVER